MTFESHASIVISGEWVRFDESIAIYDLPSRTFKPSRFSSSYAGDVTKRLFYIGGPAAEGTGVLDDDGLSTSRPRTLAPVTLCVRGVHHRISPYPLRDFTVTGARLKIGKAECEEYRSQLSKQDTVRIWTDPDQGHGVVRIERERDNRLTQRTDIRYEHRPLVSLWVPQAWTVVTYGRQGRVLTRTDATVKELAVNERDYSAEEIDVRFPEGIRVSDNRNRQEYRVTGDGTLALTDALGRVTGGEIPMPGTTFFSRNRTWILVGSAIVIAGMGVFVIRRIRLRRSVT